jgi:hypothetical protein
MLLAMLNMNPVESVGLGKKAYPSLDSLLKHLLWRNPQKARVMITYNVTDALLRSGGKVLERFKKNRMSIDDPLQGSAHKPFGMQVMMHPEVFHLKKVEDVAV